MQITFLGAAGEVTGSASLLETKDATLLIDFGLFQGKQVGDDQNIVPPQLDVQKIDAVILTHAHLDHIGRLPLLLRAGYKGPIFATRATREIGEIILRDTIKIQEQDLKRINRKRERAGLPPQEILFSSKDVEKLLSLFREVELNACEQIVKGVQAVFHDAGHILGSTCVRIVADGKNIVFSGDLGPKGSPILLDAKSFAKADAVIMESTYGDRDHRSLASTIEEFESIVKETAQRGGKILIPTFAVGRTQLLLHILAKMFQKESVRKFPVFLDSPMAIEATRIYFMHEAFFKEEIDSMCESTLLSKNQNLLKFCETAEESIALNTVPGPCMILAGSGMSTGGRILHHFRQNLWKPETSVLIVGYQAEGSLGRLLVDGARTVRIHGENVAVNAKIHTLGGFSAHAGQSDLLWWLEAMAGWKPQVLLNHGESKGREPLAKLIEERFGLDPILPLFGETITIS